jgi:hypothetical protein
MDEKMADESPIDRMARQLFGDSINLYARGNKLLEMHAIDVSRPTTIALLLPEEFAVLALTSRMDQELQKTLMNGLCKQGTVKKLLNLLFDSRGPLSSLCSKIDMAFCVGFITERMHTALTLCRQIRNMYAHSEDPHAVRQSREYKTHRKRLLELDAEWTADQTQRLIALADPTCIRDDLVVVANMVGICNSLGSAAFVSIIATHLPQSSVVPCFYGFDDVPEFREVNGRGGYFGLMDANT